MRLCIVFYSFVHAFVRSCFLFFVFVFVCVGAFVRLCVGASVRCFFCVYACVCALFFLRLFMGSKRRDTNLFVEIREKGAHAAPRRAAGARRGRRPEARACGAARRGVGPLFPYFYKWICIHPTGIFG